MDSGTEVKFTLGRSIAAISIYWNDRTGRCSPTTLEIRRMQYNEFGQLLKQTFCNTRATAKSTIRRAIRNEWDLAWEKCKHGREFFWFEVRLGKQY